jgi:hypothetical protein
MKKNKMMRVASGLMVAVLMTTSAISGTFAKYVTSNNVSDNARVAKWGVTVDTSGHLFETTYATTDTSATGITNSVVSETKVVAPGTSVNDQMLFNISGTPEVAVKVTVNAVADNDVVLPAASGTYLDYTTGNVTDDTFDLSTEYRPVKYTLKKNNVVVDGCDKVSLATIVDKLNSLEAYYEPGTNLADNTNGFGSYSLSWAWDFDDNGAGTNDKADTFLGMCASGDQALPSNASITAGFTITITVTQVD